LAGLLPRQNSNNAAKTTGALTFRPLWRLRHNTGYPGLYRMALTGFLDLRPPAPANPTEWSRERYDFHANQGDVEEALLSVLVSDAAFKAERAARLARVRVTARRAAAET
jgi:hypothetical protein